MIDEAFARFMELDRQMKIVGREMLKDLNNIELFTGVDVIERRQFFEMLLSYPPLEETLRQLEK